MVMMIWVISKSLLNISRYQENEIFILKSGLKNENGKCLRDIIWWVIHFEV